MINDKILEVLELPLFVGKITDIQLEKKNYLINTISPHSYSLSTKNNMFKLALQKSDILLLDGQYFGLAPLILNRTKVTKISGSDCFYYLMNLLNKKNNKVFFLGSTNIILQKIKVRASIDYPNIEIEYYSPPFKPLNEDDERIICNKINEFNPTVLFIGMTAPKQEILGYKIKDKINVNIICSIGNVFDWYAGEQKQPEKVWVRLGMEWFIRTLRRPEILKRYPITIIYFWHLFLYVVKIRKK